MGEGARGYTGQTSGAEALGPLSGLWALFIVELRPSEYLGEEPTPVFGKDSSGVCAGSGLWGKGICEETRAQPLPSTAGGEVWKSGGLDGRTRG